MQRPPFLLAIFAVVALLSWGVREANQMRIERVPGSSAQQLGWFSAEPDGLYHARRVEESLRTGLPVAEFDSAMNAPHGAAIPWPPYYDTILHLLLKPLAPLADQPAERKLFVERASAVLPLWFGVLTSVLVAAAAFALGGWRAGLLAGSLHALAGGSIHYSAPGIADHHSFVAFLTVAMFGMVALGFKRGVHRREAGAELFGIAGGIVAGILVGSWTASLVQVGVVELVFLGLAMKGIKERPGLPMFAASFNLAAIVALMPAVMSSPWQQLQPWVVVNLSWFHPIMLAVAVGYFASLYFFRDSNRIARFGAIGLAATSIGLWQLQLPPFSGVSEGFEWAARANVFMADIAESQPAWKDGLTGVFKWLGVAICALPSAIYACRLTQHRSASLVWVLAAVVLVAQALFQLRFSDLASIPIAILVGCWLAPLLVKFIPSCRLRIPLGLLAVALLQATTVAETIERIGYRHEDRSSVESWRQNGVRSLHEWLAANAEGNGSVLAHWDQGHALEFVAGRASVATNFGSYVGEESFRAPAEFFTASTWEEGEEILDRHRCDYVLVHSAIPSAWSQLKAAAGTSTAQWRNSLAAALTHSGGPPAPSRLRLVFVSPFKDPQPDSRLAAAGEVAPVGMIWQRVEGALLRVAAPPQTIVGIEMRIDLKSSSYAFLYQAEAVAGEDGWVELRVPYATEGLMGDAVASKAAIVRQGAKSVLKIPQSAVSNGDILTLK
ncbi:MAG: hypothetical protein COB96_00415 [Planctomycetota bacterium]|nr:MAG: hypothetical protein COB96_00415 [Planctomycetota bacterium]